MWEVSEGHVLSSWDTRSGAVRKDKSTIEACVTQIGSHPPNPSPAHGGSAFERVK